MKFHLEPLAALAGMSMPELSRALGISGTQWKDARDQGVGEKAADRYAVRLGFHPSVVWPEWTEESMVRASTECAASGCETRFFPRDRQARYCSPTCKRREKMRRYRERPNGQEANRRHRKAYYWSARDYELASMRRRRAA